MDNSYSVVCMVVVKRFHKTITKPLNDTECQQHRVINLPGQISAICMLMVMVMVMVYIKITFFPIYAQI